MLKDMGPFSGVREQVQELYGGLGTMRPYLEVPKYNCHLVTELLSLADRRTHSREAPSLCNRNNLVIAA